MKVISVVGFTKSGKTTTIENIIRELRKRNYSVGSVKDIHYEKFAIDTEGSNTMRHRHAGSQLVTARGMFETDILYQSKLDIFSILKHYDQDYVILEGVSDAIVPKIICAKSLDEIGQKEDSGSFLVSGVLANEIKRHDKYDVINALTDIENLVDRVEEVAMYPLPNIDDKCCMACGYTCDELLYNILNGDCSLDNCIINKGNIELSIDGEDIKMVPFVKKILCNNIISIVSELDGYMKDKDISININLK